MLEAEGVKGAHGFRRGFRSLVQAAKFMINPVASSAETLDLYDQLQAISEKRMNESTERITFPPVEGEAKVALEERCAEFFMRPEVTQETMGDFFFNLSQLLGAEKSGSILKTRPLIDAKTRRIYSLLLLDTPTPSGQLFTSWKESPRSKQEFSEYITFYRTGDLEYTMSFSQDDLSRLGRSDERVFTPHLTGIATILHKQNEVQKASMASFGRGEQTNKITFEEMRLACGKVWDVYQGVGSGEAFVGKIPRKPR